MIVDGGDIEYPMGFGSKDIVAWGNTGMVCLDAPSQTVIKTPHDEQHAASLEVERRIYERFQEHGGHKGILQYYGTFDKHGIRLEFAPNFNLCSTLRKQNTNISQEQRLRWVKQVIDAVAFVHSVQIVHGDITCSNIFLSSQMDAKLGDFGGSSIDGSDLLVVVTESHRFPGELLSTRADIFALGSAIYHIMTGVAPYHNLSSNDIDDRFKAGQFPDTSALGPIGKAITRCWQGQYNNVGDVRNDIEGKICA